ncbi:hypothetical protein BD770DRAFT_381581, partial [Pilaira anomala]
MDRLPTEHFVTTFLLLRKSDRVRLALVCKRWYTIIRDHCLYQELKLDSVDRFDRTIETFDNHPHLKKQVKTLIINNFQLDIYSILLMPQYFVNIKGLEWSEEDRPWEERQSLRKSITSIPSLQVYQHEFKKWDKLEYIRVILERLPFVTLILRSSKLTNLTKLSVSFQRLHLDQHYGASTMQRVIPIVKEIIKNLKYVQSLKYLHFEKPVLALDDMEQIHQNIPKLEELQLNFVCMSPSCQSRSAIPNLAIANKSPAAFVRRIDFTFYINSSSELHTIQKSQRAMANWLTYISVKYTKLVDMVLELSNYDGVPIIPEFEESITTIIRNTSDLSYYSGQLYPITNSIMETIDDSHAKLKEIYLFADKMDDMEIQADYISASTQAKTLNELTLYTWDLELDEDTIGSFHTVLTKLSLDFLSLTSLHLDLLMHYKTLVQVLKTLPLLAVLTLQSIKVDANEVVDIMPITKSNIKCLEIELTCEGDIEIDKINHVLMFSLQSCPRLEEFRLSADFSNRSCGLLQLHFPHQEQLKEVSVNVKGIQYYTFSWKEGKQGIMWSDYDNPLESNRRNSTLCLDIAWRNKITKLNLEAAPVV